jgi:ABC-type branched-subunit amino acid transport system ATPase component
MSAPLLSLHEVGVRFGGLVALNGFSMDVQPGTIHALIGPNGAGKSTAFNAISRFYNLAQGEIRFDGRPISRLPQHRIAELGIARTFQNIELCKRLTVLENVLIGMSAPIATCGRKSSTSGTRRCSTSRARWRAGRSSCCSTSRPPGCATAKSRHSIRCS